MLIFRWMRKKTMNRPSDPHPAFFSRFRTLRGLRTPLPPRLLTEQGISLCHDLPWGICNVVDNADA